MPLGAALRTHGTQKTLVNAIQRTTHKQLMDTHTDNHHPEAMKSLTWRVFSWRAENGVVGSQSCRGGFGNLVTKHQPLSFHFEPLKCLPKLGDHQPCI